MPAEISFFFPFHLRIFQPSDFPSINGVLVRENCGELFNAQDSSMATNNAVDQIFFLSIKILELFGRAVVAGRESSPRLLLFEHPQLRVQADMHAHSNKQCKLANYM